jgi:uncharacterized protein
VWLAALAEAGLALVALGLAAWAGVAPLAAIRWNERGLAQGIVATAPLLLGLWWCRRTSVTPVARLVAFVETRVAPIFAGAHVGQLALVALMAGVGEELLFRGVLQPVLGAHVSVWPAVLIVGGLFGLAHWLTPMYALLAGIVGTYLGAVFVASGNLLVPIVVHALYDLVALVTLTRVKPPPTSSVL